MTQSHTPIVIDGESLRYRSVKTVLTLLLFCLHTTVLQSQTKADTVTIETSGNYITMPVTLNGKSRRFILDTGCGANVVFSHAVDNLEQVTLNGDSIVGSTGSTEAAGIMMGRLKVSSFDSEDLTPIYVTAVDSIMMLRADGIVGMQYLLSHNRMNMKIDVRRQQVIFTRDKHLFDDEEGTKLRTKIADNRLTIKTKISPGVKVKNVVVDTGCDHLFALDADDFNYIMTHKHGERFSHQVVGEKSSEMGDMYGLSEQPTTALLLDQLTVAGLRFHNVDVETGRESLLGFPLLQAASVIIYHKGKRIKVSPYTVVRDYRIVRQEEKVKRAGYTITYRKEKVVESWFNESNQ